MMTIAEHQVPAYTGHALQVDEYMFSSLSGRVVLKTTWNPKRTRVIFEYFSQETGEDRLVYDYKEHTWQQDIWPNKFEWQAAVTRDAVLEAFSYVEM